MRQSASRWLGLAGAAVIGVAQVAHPAPPQDQQTPVFGARTDVVVVHATVTDRRGGYVRGLAREAFRVTENGRPQQLSFFTGDDSPATIGLLVDGSGSMQPLREQVVAAATAFATAGRDDDELFALTFNEQVRAALPPAVPFTRDRSVFSRAFASAFAARGRTATHDAIVKGLAHVALGHHPRHALVVIGDGGDNASSVPFDAVLTQAQASGAVIYAVGVVDPRDREAKPDHLRRLARATGGRAYFPRRVEEIGPILRTIAEDVRQGYTLGYISTANRGSPAPRGDGGFRRVQVSLSGPDSKGLSVRAREGYREPIR